LWCTYVKRKESIERFDEREAFNEYYRILITQMIITRAHKN
jgi:hypothetical protein